MRRIFGGVGITINQRHLDRLLKRLRDSSEEDRAAALKCNRSSLYMAVRNLWVQVRQGEVLETVGGRHHSS